MCFISLQYSFATLDLPLSFDLTKKSHFRKNCVNGVLEKKTKKTISEAFAENKEKIELLKSIKFTLSLFS